MRKNSSVGAVCTYCDKPALPDTYPPVCEECQESHKQLSKEATEKAGDKEPEVKSLKELQTK